MNISNATSVGNAILLQVNLWCVSRFIKSGRLADDLIKVCILFSRFFLSIAFAESYSGHTLQKQQIETLLLGHHS